MRSVCVCVRQGRFEIYNRDFSEATGEDKFDKQILPKVMQLRKGQFGRAGRTKWTHLADQDTTIAAKKEGDDFYSLDRGIREKCARLTAGAPPSRRLRRLAVRARRLRAHVLRVSLPQTSRRWRA